MRPSLRRRLALGSIGAVVVVLAIVGAVVVALMRSSLETEFDASLAARARELALQVEQDRGRISYEIDAKAIAGNEALAVWGDGKVLAHIGGELVAGDGVQAIELGGRAMRQITVRFAPRREPDDPIDNHPAAVLVLARTTAEIDGPMHHIEMVFLVVGGVGIALCALLVLLSVRFGLRPMRDLAASIEALKTDDLSARLASASTAEELAPVAERLDGLLGRLSAAFARERELTAEIAHELRTPLAGLRATIEVVLDRDRPVERYRAALADCLAITRQTEGLVESLLSLARLDAGQARAAATPIDIDQLVRDTVAVAHVRASDRKLTLVTELAAVTRTIDGDKLRVAIANLIENAVAYALEGSTVTIALAGTTLTVANASLFAAADAPRVFERFWRADAARSSSGHVGLGLPLAKKLVDLLGGTLSVAVGNGTFTATLELP